MNDDPIDITDLTSLLVEAIADQRLKRVAEHMIDAGRLDNEGQVLARRAVAACQAISQQMAEVQAEAVTAMSEAGVSAKPLGDIARVAQLQFHSADLSISRGDLGPALAALKGIGFAPSIEMTPGRVAALRRTAARLQLVRFDKATTRLILHFDTDAPTLLPRALRPRTADLAMVSLPAALSPLYGVTKPLRMAREKLTGRRSPHHEIDFLGTPEGLIAPILDGLSLKPDDVLLDLGCGDGRILTVAAERFGCRAIGVEHNADLVARARDAARASEAGGRIEVRQGGAATADLSEATVVFMFLPSGLLRDLMPSVRGRMRSGARLVMHEQSRPGGVFQEDQALPIFGPEGVTVVRVLRV